MNNPKNKFVKNCEIEEIKGGEKVTSVSMISKDTNKATDVPIDGVFVAIGHVPNSAVFKGIDTNEEGYIKVHEHMKTNIDGVFVAGDVHDHHYRQAITAAGFG